MAWIDDQLSQIERQRGVWRESLKKLKSGDLNLYEGVGRGRDRDITKEAIETTESTILQLNKLQAFYTEIRDSKGDVG